MGSRILQPFWPSSANGFRLIASYRLQRVKLTLGQTVSSIIRFFALLEVTAKKLRLLFWRLKHLLN
jgi:hypothetical protein